MTIEFAFLGGTGTVIGSSISFQAPGTICLTQANTELAANVMAGLLSTATVAIEGCLLGRWAPRQKHWRVKCNHGACAPSRKQTPGLPPHDARDPLQAVLVANA